MLGTAYRRVILRLRFSIVLRHGEIQHYDGIMKKKSR